MSQRERQASGGVAEAIMPRGGASAPVRAAPLAESPRAAFPSWDDIYLHATPAQREQLLAFARTQGLVYASQLPALTNGNSGDSVGSEPLRLLARKFEVLDHSEPVTLQIEDQDLRTPVSARRLPGRCIRPISVSFRAFPAPASCA